jgi:uncharacterized protein
MNQLKRMKTDLDHLPGKQQRDIARVVQILFEEFEAGLAHATAPHNRNAKILKIILFGSYARGDWVRDLKSGYVSDYDILVVVNHEKLTEIIPYWEGAEERLMRDFAIHKRLAAPLGLIVHSLEDVNDQLRCGRYFFMDIIKEGIALYDAPQVKFVKPQPLSPELAYEEAKGYFDQWLSSALEFFQGAMHAINDAAPKLAAFLLHQTSERLYQCTLLTFTLYGPASHNLNFLRSRAEELDKRLIAAWPRATKRERRPFELIRRAYIEARYSPHYKITPQELVRATEQIIALRDLVRAACEQRLAEMKARIERA